jgi:hypothetical protein
VNAFVALRDNRAAIEALERRTVVELMFLPFAGTVGDSSGVIHHRPFIAGLTHRRLRRRGLQLR